MTMFLMTLVRPVFQGVLALGLLLVLSGCSWAVSKAPVSPAKKAGGCSEIQARLEAKREALHSALDGLSSCAKAGDINYDCTQDYDSTAQHYEAFQHILNKELKPCVNPNFKKP